MRYKGRSQKKIKRFLLLLTFSTLILPINFKGLSYGKVYGLNKTSRTFTDIDPKFPGQIKVGNDEGVEYQAANSGKKAKRSDPNVATNENYGAEEVQPNTNISPGVIGSMVVIFFISPILTLLILSYLQEQPLNKQCVMNKLYQDVIKANLLMIWLWTCSALILNYSTSASAFMEMSQAKGVGLVNQAFNQAPLHRLEFNFDRVIKTLCHNI